MKGSAQKAAVVTGGSSGLGLELARGLAGRGFAPVLIARRREQLDAAAASLHADGFETLAISADVTDAAAMRAAAASVREAGHSVAWLVNCAGTVHPGTVASAAVEDLRADLDVNLRGSVLAAKFFLPLVEDGGSVLFIASGFGLMGPAGYAAYAAAKAGVIAFAEAIQREVHVRGIAVHAAVPSDIETPGLRREIAALPAWLRIAGARGRPLPADVAARQMLDRCKRGRFLIYTDGGVRMLSLCSAVLPRRLRNAVIDRMFPRPPRDDA
jgi:3-dehydrosphinganine reductase